MKFIVGETYGNQTVLKQQGRYYLVLCGNCNQSRLIQPRKLTDTCNRCCLRLPPPWSKESERIRKAREG